MSTTIYYYTGTGNSLWVARQVAEKLGETQLISIPSMKDVTPEMNSVSIGLIFPVYIWGVPAPVLRFLDKLQAVKADYIFAVAVCGGQVANTLVQLQKVMQGKGLTLNSGFDITMPSNYIPWGGPGSEESQRGKFEIAAAKIARIAPKIQQKETLPVEKGKLWQRILFTQIYNMSFAHTKTFDKKFWVDEKCNGCKICVKVCPAGNIRLEDEKPVWQHNCDQCFACLQWCPQEAIQNGKKTPNYERYHHPEVKLKDVLKVE